ncbi:carboxylesterase family protein [Mucilaginibacter sp. UYCu711]|uniref:carboxylesterase family protein n=1 Tax=Mucilaginibacter sp. UYCu711 TaxID=3156339 RepID=UPI003D2297F1
MLKIIKIPITCIVVCLLLAIGFSSWKTGAATIVKYQQKDTSLRDVIYGSNVNADGKQQSLIMDIYFPPNVAPGKTYPMVMLIHGGTFLNGSKGNLTTHCKELADSGFVAVSIDYRLGWNALSALGGCDKVDVNSLTLANYRAIQDTHAAMRFLVANAGQYHIDAKWLFIGGGSAGAITALDIAYVNQKFANDKFAVAVTALGNIDTASNKYTNKFKIKGICDMWGALPDSTLINKKTALPTIFYHGTADKTVPYDRGYYMPNCTRVPELFGSACLYRQMVAAGKVAVFNTSIGGKHGPVEFTGKVIASNTACFFHKVMQGKAKGGEFDKVIMGCH